MTGRNTASLLTKSSVGVRFQRRIIAMLLAIAFLCFVVQIAAWIVLPSSAGVIAEDLETEIVAEAAAA